jgi:hypothetical protein
MQCSNVTILYHKDIMKKPGKLSVVWNIVVKEAADDEMQNHPFSQQRKSYKIELYTYLMMYQ